MPILAVRALPQRDPSRVPAALKATCVRVAQEYGCEARQVWATWQEIAPGFYVEGEIAMRVQPPASHPPIVTLTCYEGKSPDVIERVLLAAATALSEELGIPGNVFVAYEEAKAGRTVAGDGVVRR